MEVIGQLVGGVFLFFHHVFPGDQTHVTEAASPSPTSLNRSDLFNYQYLSFFVCKIDIDTENTVSQCILLVIIFKTAHTSEPKSF